MSRKEAVTKALGRLGIASPSEIWKVAVQIEPSLTLEDVNLELYHGSRDPENLRYEKITRGKYALASRVK